MGESGVRGFGWRDMTDEILKRIDALAAKLGVASDHLWRVLTQQARIEAIEDLAWAALFFALSGASIWAIRWVIARRDDDNIPGELGVVSVIAALVFFVVACNCIAGTPGMFLNPEYWALKQILETVKGK